MKHRGLYKQAEGNEHRRTSEATAEHYADNEVVEGQEVKAIKGMMRKGQWVAVANYVDDLRLKGWEQIRLDAIISRAKFGIRF